MSDEESPSIPVTKIGSFITVSNEVLADALQAHYMMANLWKPDTRTDEEKRAAHEAWMAEGAAAQAAITAEHSTVLARVHPVLIPILELHGPVFSSEGDLHAHCEGCEVYGYEAEEPGFPCQTYILASS